MKARVISTEDENYADFRLPDDSVEFALHVMAILKTEIRESRVTEFGYVGPAIEIRRIPE